MRFKVSYKIGKKRIPFTEIVTCTTVGELYMSIQLILHENDLSYNQITVHEL